LFNVLKEFAAPKTAADVGELLTKSIGSPEQRQARQHVGSGSVLTLKSRKIDELKK
jgi:hypothetical protein